LGGVFGALKITFLLSVVLNFFAKANDTLPLVDAATIEESMLYQPVKSLLPTVFPNLMDKEIPQDNVEETQEDAQ
ncbi:MAG: CvpA family protein, partial [Mangrovimonas sp.]|nr:CvpA family protein [Mangrovimonas sp.]